jgi:hypothetical protein
MTWRALCTSPYLAPLHGLQEVLDVAAQAEFDSKV